MSLRAIPNLWVVRPGDANETAMAWRIALERADGPVALALSRQKLPTLDRDEVAPADGSAARGVHALAARRRHARTRSCSRPAREVHDRARGRAVSSRMRTSASSRCPAGSSSRRRTRPTATRCCRRACAPASRSRPGITFGWERWGATAAHRRSTASARRRRTSACYEELGLTAPAVARRAARGRCVKVAAGFDHRGTILREAVLEAIRAAGHEPVDLGVDDDVRSGSTTRTSRATSGWRSGRARPSAGSSCAAPASAPRSPPRRSPGSARRSATTSTRAHQGVEHDDMNVLCLGSGVIGDAVAARARRGLPRCAVRRARGATSRASRRSSDWRRWSMASRVCTPCSAAGVSVWIDSLSREMLAVGRARAADRRGRGHRASPRTRPSSRRRSPRVTATTSSCAALDPALSTGRRVLRARAGGHPRRLRPAGARCSSGRAALDGWVSLEVDPTLAYDREATFEQAIRLHAEVERPNLYVKIPATLPGLGAIEDCIAKGRSINVTLIFSLERYAAVLEAYVRGLERRAAAGGDLRSGLVGRELLRLPGRHARPTAASPRRVGATCRAGSPSRTPSSRTRTGRRWSRARAGRSSPRRAPARSAASGPRPRRRTRPTATSSTSRSWSGRRRSTRCPPRPSPPSRTTARCGTSLTEDVDGARSAPRRARRARASTTTTSWRRSRRRASRSSRTRSPSCSPGSRPKRGHARAVSERPNPLLEGLGLRRRPDPCALVIFGASGDLTKRKLFPALYALAVRRLLPGALRASSASPAPSSRRGSSSRRCARR